MLALGHGEHAVLHAGVDLDRDRRLGDHGHPGHTHRQHLEQAVAGTGADQDRVAPLPQRDLELDHG